MKSIYGSKSRSALSIVLILSLGLHILGLVAFGAFKVVQSITREEQTFEAPPINPAPPPVPEPKVNLEQRNQQSAPPRPNPITVDSPQDIDLPALNIDLNIDKVSAYGRGSGGFGSGSGAGSIREMSVELTDFGYSQFVEGTLQATLYDFKQDPDGKPTDLRDPAGGYMISRDYWNATIEVVEDFATGSWSTNTWERRYFSAEKNLYGSYFIIPFQKAANTPKAFGVEGKVEPRQLAAVYKGTFKPRKTGRFRFYGRGDDILIVRLNNRIVLDGSWDLNRYSDFEVDMADEQSFGEVLFGFSASRPGVYGDWFNFREGQEVDLEIIIGEVPGGDFGAWLLIEDDERSGPRIFSTRPLSEKDKQHLLQLHPDSKRFMP